MITIRIQADRFDAGAELALLSARDGVGGLGCFVGQVRGGDDLVALTLEHYPGMAEAALRVLADQAVQRWPLLGCTIIHRVGRLAVGEPIVLVAAASAHRHAALAATGFLIDALKTDAPFWKSQDRADGSRSWVEPRGEDGEMRSAWADVSSGPSAPAQ